MLTTSIVLLVSLLYLGVLFAIASYGDRRADQGRSLIRSPWVYTLSLGVYCTAWTFYGSVGLASRQGLGFLPVYLGPTLAALMFGFLVLKMLRIAKAQGITSIADFLAARYGKSALLAGLVTVVAVVSAIPYIALQLKAVSTSVTALIGSTGGPAGGADAALLVLLLIALFSVLFGTRHIDATEHHEGMVLAVAFESLVKLAAFLIVGVVRHLGDVRRLRRHLRPGRQPADGTAADRAGRRRRLCRLVPDHRAVRARLPVPGPAVPGRGDRERRRGASAHRELAPAGLSARHQPVRAADRARRAPARLGRWRPVRAAAAPGVRPRLAGARGLSRRAVGRVGHDHRRHGGAQHHGLQRPGHPGSAAPGRPRRRAAARSAAPDPDDPSRVDPAPAGRGLRLLPPGRRILPPGQHWPDRVLRRRPVRAADRRRPLLARGQPHRRCPRPRGRRRRLALHARPADPRHRRAGRRGDRRATARSGWRCCGRRNSWGSPAWVR